MSRRTVVSDSVVIAAPAAEIYRQVSDPTQMGRWSEENVGATVLDRSEVGSSVGMRFDGHNRRGPLRGRWSVVMPRWTTRRVVTAAEEPRRFAFLARFPIVPGKDEPRVALDMCTWEYQFEEVSGNTKVTETWTDVRAGSRMGRFSYRVERILTGGPDLPEFQARNIASTLGRLKQAIEADQ